MDSISKKDQPNSSFDQGILAQPLKLKESLRIRDGLGDQHDAPLVRWRQSRGIPLTISDLGYFWVSNN